MRRRVFAWSKATRNFLLVFGFYSADGTMSNVDIGDYVASML